ncbi:MAG: LrgB family protein, partial [Bacteroidota bacterium]
MLIGVLLTLGIFFLADSLYKRTSFLLLNPVLVSIASIIIILQLSGFSYEAYMEGGQLISFLLGPSVVALGVVFYEKLQEIGASIWRIVLAVCLGGTLSIISMRLLSQAFQLSQEVSASLIPSSVTTPIAMGISTELGGIPSLTAAVVILVGITGAAFGIPILKMLGMRTDIVMGAGIGASS